jgi:hypothetical protein
MLLPLLLLLLCCCRLCLSCCLLKLPSLLELQPLLALLLALDQPLILPICCGWCWRYHYWYCCNWRCRCRSRIWLQLPLLLLLLLLLPPLLLRLLHQCCFAGTA